MQKQSLSLDELRAAIDGVDDEILSLLWRRAGLAAAVGEQKQGSGDTPFYVPSREASIIRRLLESNQQQANGRVQLPDAAVHGVFREVIGACLALEHPLSVAFLGPEGTFSHTAANRQFGATADYQSCASFEQVFAMVERGQVAYGLIPVENTLEGAVTHALDLFAEPERTAKVCAEVKLEIHHHLFSYAPLLSDIRQVISHRQPLAQCRGWLEAYLPQAELMESASTVEGVQMVMDARHGDGVAAVDWRHAAAIGSYGMVDRCDLDLLQRNIEDQRDNTTRFYVIGGHDSPPSGRDKTALVISIQDEPGALYTLIRPFAKRDIGLTRIESRPSRKEQWAYLFFVDVAGHRQDPPLADALQEIGQMASVQVRVLGSCPVSKPL